MATAVGQSVRRDLATYRRFLPLLRPHIRRLALAVAASACTPLLFAAKIWLLKVLIDSVLRGHRPDLVPAVAAGFVVIAVLRTLITSMDERYSGTAGTAIVRDLRVAVFAHLQSMSLRYFHGQRLGDLLTRLSGDIAAIEDVLASGLTAMARNVVTVVVFSTLLVVLDPQLVLVAVAVVPLLVGATVLDARFGRQAQRGIRDSTSNLTSTAEEALSAIALVKSFARSGHETARFRAAADRSARARLRAIAVRAVFPPLSELVGALGTAAVVWVGAGQVLAGTLSLGSLVVFISYLASLLNPIQGLGRLASTVQRALVGAERVAEVLDAPPSLRERQSAPDLPPVRGRVSFERVSFAYGPQRPAVQHIDLHIEPGEMVAVVGPSGAGKTTLVSLLLNYYHPQYGSVRLDGLSTRAFNPDSVRRQVAAVLQEPMLFDTSVRENVRYGRLDASDEEVEAACAVAQADPFVRRLPLGYDTVVGPRGSLLSGGQRQRLAIARAVVKGAPVMVLDEATSALDPETESRVLPALRLACSGSAILVVAHRFSTLRHADRIVVMEQGHVVEGGTHADLLAVGGPYSRLARAEREPTGRPT